MQLHTGFSDRKLEYYQQKNGTLADWIASENHEFEDMLHARIRSIEPYLSDFDRSILDLHGRQSLTQSRIAEITGKSQSTISQRYAKILERVRYWIFIEENCSEIGRALRDLDIDDDNARAVLAYLQGAPYHRACPKRSASTIYDMISRVRKAAATAASRRSMLLAGAIDARRQVRTF